MISLWVLWLTVGISSFATRQSIPQMMTVPEINRAVLIRKAIFNITVSENSNYLLTVR